MKTNFLFLLCMMISLFAFGQEEKQMLQVNLDEVKVVAPTFTGIQRTMTLLQESKSTSLEDYLMKNINYPEEAVKQFARGTEIVQFVVTPEGAVTDFNVINSVSLQIDEEVIRVLKTTNGMWMPGYNNDKPVAMEKEVAIAFNITGWSNTADFNSLAKKYYSDGSTLLLIKGNAKKALKSFDKGIRLMPNDESLLLTRGLARYEVGDKEGAIRDWTRLKELGINLGDYYVNNFDGLKGYAELARILEE